MIVNIKSSRRSIRLPKYDYSKNGRYYVTICTQNRKCIFGEIVAGNMKLNDIGKMIGNVWKTLPDHHHVKLDIIQIMPNHVHFVLQINQNDDKQSRRGLIHQTRKLDDQTRNNFGQWMGMINHALTLGHIVRFFKAKTSRLSGQKLWQRNFWEHIIRTEPDLIKIQSYIENNPKMWEGDRNNPDHQ